MHTYIPHYTDKLWPFWWALPCYQILQLYNDTKKHRLSQISHKTITVMSISFIFIFAILMKYLLVICTYFSKCWILLDKGQTSWKLAVFHRVEQLSMISRKLEFTCTKNYFSWNNFNYLKFLNVFFHMERS